MSISHILVLGHLTWTHLDAFQKILKKKKLSVVNNLCWRIPTKNVAMSSLWMNLYWAVHPVPQQLTQSTFPWPPRPTAQISFAGWSRFWWVHTYSRHTHSYIYTPMHFKKCIWIKGTHAPPHVHEHTGTCVCTHVHICTHIHTHTPVHSDQKHVNKIFTIKTPFQIPALITSILRASVDTCSKQKP